MHESAQRPRSGSSAGKAPGFGSAGTSSFGAFCPVDSWAPPLNIYRMADCIDVCVELAGVDRDTIEVHLEPGRLTIRGQREAPQPDAASKDVMRIVMMEIRHGSFCRTITLPDQIDIATAESNYEAGLLWVRIPLRRASSGRKR